MHAMTLNTRLRIHQVDVLSDDWFVLKKTRFDWLRSDGRWQTVSRETYDRGDGATLLPFDRHRRTVLLIRQFRYPVYVNGHPDLLIETPAGQLEHAAPEARIRAEVEEETGYRLSHVHKVFEAFMSPGSVTEKLHFFVGEYSADMRVGAGGGLPGEGEDIELLELPFDEALRGVADGRIVDAKTLLLLQYAQLHLFATTGARR